MMGSEMMDQHGKGPLPFKLCRIRGAKCQDYGNTSLMGLRILPPHWNYSSGTCILLTGGVEKAVTGWLPKKAHLFLGSSFFLRKGQAQSCQFLHWSSCFINSSFFVSKTLVHAGHIENQGEENKVQNMYTNDLLCWFSQIRMFLRKLTSVCKFGTKEYSDRTAINELKYSYT